MNCSGWRAAPNGAFRACNGVYNTFALERHTDEICAAIGIHPLAFRRRAILGDGDFGSTGQVFEGDVLGPMLDRMAELRAAKPSKRLMAGTRLYGRATTVGTWFVFVGPSAATINLNADGSATLVTSGVEIGSGSMMQALPQIVANVLGLRPEDVIVRAADTDAGGYDVGVGGGRTTVSLGAASMAACVEVRRKLLGLRVDGDVVPAPGDRVSKDGHEIGRVTSAAWSPTFGRVIALGILRLDAVSQGDRLSIGHGDRNLPARIGSLPF